MENKTRAYIRKNFESDYAIENFEKADKYDFQAKEIELSQLEKMRDKYYSLRTEIKDMKTMKQTLNILDSVFREAEQS